MEDNIRESIKGLGSDEAIEILSAYLSSHPDDEEALTLRGIKYWSAGKRSLAIGGHTHQSRQPGQGSAESRQRDS
jgi:hypothetical protein